MSEPIQINMGRTAFGETPLWIRYVYVYSANQEEFKSLERYDFFCLSFQTTCVVPFVGAVLCCSGSIFCAWYCVLLFVLLWFSFGLECVYVSPIFGFDYCSETSSPCFYDYLNLFTITWNNENSVPMEKVFFISACNMQEFGQLI